VRRDGLDVHGFAAYLYSHHNDWFDRDAAALPDTEMTRPLAHYFINSSHNTYAPFC
jgi:hypothetical protein